MHRTSRLLAGCVVTLLTAAALSGCAGAGGSTAGCTPVSASGQASDDVHASGRFGTAPKVSFDTPIHVTDTQTSSLIPGSGAPISSRQEVVADLTILDGTTGTVVQKTSYAGRSSAAAFVVDSVPIPGLRKALVCAQVGERLAVVMPPAQGFASDSRPTTLSATDTVVAVLDVRDAFLARANGTDQVMGDGLPAVVLGPDGRPGVTLPEGDPPTTLQVADLKKGSGAVIRKGDTAIVQYTGVLWKPGDPANGTVFDSSWTSATHAPATFSVKDGQLVKGFVTALSGQRVGSQVLAVLPPSQAYGKQSTSSVPPDSTLVFVVDVLGKV